MCKRLETVLINIYCIYLFLKTDSFEYLEMGNQHGPILRLEESGDEGNLTEGYSSPFYPNQLQDPVAYQLYLDMLEGKFLQDFWNK